MALSGEPHNAPVAKTTEATRAEHKQLRSQPPPLLRKFGYASYIYTVQSLAGPFNWYHGWKEWFYPPDVRPNIVKSYECRPHLPVR